jgi:hypothetical protein
MPVRPRTAARFAGEIAARAAPHSLCRRADLCQGVRDPARARRSAWRGRYKPGPRCNIRGVANKIAVAE